MEGVLERECQIPSRVGPGESVLDQGGGRSPAGFPVRGGDGASEVRPMADREGEQPAGSVDRSAEAGIPTVNWDVHLACELAS